MTAPENPWITWEGGECPVDPDAKVEVICRDGYKTEEVAGELAGTPRWDWWKHEPAPYSKEGYGPNHSDIIAYRLVKP